MTSAAPEPTDEQRATAMVACGHRGWTTEQLSLTQHERVEAVARALAAAVAAEREKVHAMLEVVNEMELDTVLQGLVNGSYYARRIREVSR